MDDKNSDNYSITLKAARINKGLTLGAAAAKLGISYQTLSKYEKNAEKISFGFLIKLSELYEVPLNNLNLIPK